MNLIELEKNGRMALSCAPIDASRLEFVGKPRHNVTGRLERSVLHDMRLLRDILSSKPLRHLIQSYLGATDVCIFHICAVSCPNEGTPVQAMHRDIMDDHGQVLTLALSTSDQPVSTRFVPRSHRHRDKYSALSGTTDMQSFGVTDSVNNCVLYDPCIIHHGVAGASDWRVFVTFTENTGTDDLRSKVVQFTGFDNLSDSYGASS